MYLEDWEDPVSDVMTALSMRKLLHLPAPLLHVDVYTRVQRVKNQSLACVRPFFVSV